MLTVREIFETLPHGTRVVAGAAGLDRALTWVVGLRTRQPIFPAIKGGELALFATAALAQIEPPIPLEDAIARLGERGVAAIGVAGPISHAAVAESERRGIPLLVLPADTHLIELESALVRLIGEQRTELYQWGSELERSLAEVSIGGGGLAGMVALLAGLLGLPVIWQDGLGRTVMVEAPSAAGLALAEVKGCAGDAALSGAGRSLTGGAVSKLPCSLPGWSRWSNRVAVGRSTVGYLSLLIPTGRTGTRERLALDRAGLAFAQEAAKERAVQAAETRLQRDYLNALLTAPAGDLVDLQRRSRQFALDLARPYEAVVLHVQTDGGVADDADAVTELLMQRLGHLVQGPVELLVGADDGRLVVLVPAEASGRRLAEETTEVVARAMGGVSVSAGVGRPYTGVEGVRTSFREARMALEIGLGLYGAGKTTAFEDLGAYRLLYALRGHSELAAFFVEMLGPLQRYDQENNTELVRTLEAYFAADGVLSKAAERLFLHRNSLAYRLHRIEEITGRSLESAESRFHLQLALKIWRLLPERVMSDG